MSSHIPFMRTEQGHRLVSANDISAVLQPGLHDLQAHAVEEGAKVRHPTILRRKKKVVQ